VSTIYFQTQEELRSVAELYWAASARLHRVTGYTGLAEIFAAAPNATHRQQIRSWNIRLNSLQKSIDKYNSEYADQQRVLAYNTFQRDQTRPANIRNFHDHDRYPQDLHDGVGALDIPPHSMQALSIPGQHMYAQHGVCNQTFQQQTAAAQTSGPDHVARPLHPPQFQPYQPQYFGRCHMAPPLDRPPQHFGRESSAVSLGAGHMAPPYGTSWPESSVLVGARKVNAGKLFVMTEEVRKRWRHLVLDDIPMPAYLVSSSYEHIGEFWKFCLKLQYASFWESDTKCAILTAANFNNAWEQHLLKQGRGADMKGSVSLLHKSKPHLIHVWSALRCALTMDSSTENVVKAFWEGAAPSLRKLLSVWVTGPMGDHETRSELMQTQQGLARDALMYIRQIRPAWPDLGESDFQRLTAYVVSGSDLYSAWLNRKELQPLETPAKQPQPHLTLAIAYSTDTVESTYTKNSVKSKSSADQPAAAAQRRSKSATGNDRSTIASKPGHDDLANAPGLDDLANAAARAQAAESQADSAAQAETESEPESHQSAGLGRMDSSPSGFFASPVYEGSLDHAEAPCASDHCDGLEGASPDCAGLGAELLLEVPTAPNASLGIQQGQNDIMTAHVKASAEHDLSGNQNVIMAELPNASAENDLSVGEGQNDIMAAHEGQQTAQCVEAAINQEGKVEKGKRKRTEKEKKGKVEKGKRKRTAEGGSVAQGAERRRRRASGVAPEAESTPAASAAAKPFNSAPSPSPPHHDSVSNAAHSKALDCRETDVFAESGYCSLNIEFSFDVKQQLNALMINIPTLGPQRIGQGESNTIPVM